MDLILVLITSIALFFNLLFVGTGNHSDFNLSYSIAIKGDSASSPNCTECHDVMEKSTKHAPALDNGCDNCHQGNASIHQDSLGKTFTLSDKVPPLCLNCHEIPSKSSDSLIVVEHGAVKQGKYCLNCHSPHSSNEQKLLVKNEKELCLSCHNKSITSNNNRKLANIKQTLTNSKVIHAPVEENCTTCHNPHASKTNNLLIKNFPENNYTPVEQDVFALCFDCHDTGLLDEKSNDATNFKNGTANLHFKHINGSKGRNCIMCHNVHASVNQHLIQTKVPFGSWKMKLNYMPSENGGSCLPGCHAEKKYDRVAPVINN